MRRTPTRFARSCRRTLRFEDLERRELLAVDLDDAISEARSLGTISISPRTASGRIDPDTDVDMYRFNVAAGQTVDFDIDTPFNGPGGLGSYLRLFDSTGRQLAVNDDGVAPGETQLGFDSYLRHTFATGGTFFLGVSNWINASYDPVTGDRDTSGGQHTVGDYQLTVQGLPNDADDTLAEAVSLGRVTSTPTSASGRIDPDIDVDIYRFTVSAGQAVDFDIDTPFNGPGGLGSVLRLFDSTGQQLAFNNDAAAPGETQFGFDAYLRHTFDVAGTYFIAVSNWNNVSYNPTTGEGDRSGGLHATGDYQLIVNTAPPDGFDGQAVNRGTAPSAARSPESAAATTPSPIADSSSAAAAPQDLALAAQDPHMSPRAASVAAVAARSTASRDAFFAEMGSQSDRDERGPPLFVNG